jgi:hypothetical protein
MRTIMIVNNTLFIPGAIPSLKNSKIKTAHGIFPSKTVAKFLRSYGIKSFSSSKKTVENYKTIPDTFRPLAMELKELLKDEPTPYKLGFYFVRRTKSRFDFGNAVEIVSDLLSAYNAWEDDNCDIFLPFPMLRNGVVYEVNKDNPGVYITLIK